MASRSKEAHSQKFYDRRLTSVEVENTHPIQESNGSVLLKQFFSNEGNIDDIEQTNAIDQAELEFLRQFKDELCKNDIPFLESIPANAYLAERVIAMKNKVTVPLKGKEEINTLIGPTISKGINLEPEQSHSDIVSARTISTYPVLRSKKREGNPICDSYAFKLYGNRSMCVIADGCNWGNSSRKASKRARDAVLEYMSKKHEKIYSIGDAQMYLLRAFNEAHRNISRNNSVDKVVVGTTTLLAGITLEIQGAPRCPNEWAFICASVGDCKAFLIEHDTLKVRDITQDNRSSQIHDGDCGGRLGPVMPNGGPDLRNLRTYCIRCQPGDMIMAVSDGVHDNFHPQMLSVTPREMKLDFESWEEATKVIDVEEAASKYRVQSIQHLIAELECTPTTILNAVLDHCNKLTKASREWLKNNPKQKLPTDFRKYPGKMDHTTCVVFRVGIADGSFSRSSSQIEEIKREPTYIPLSATIVESEETVSICCRTIAKGKFECLAKKKECILSVAPRTPFNSPDSEEILELNELCNTITRVISFPPGVEIDIHTKKISYDSHSGIITIKFNRLS